MTEAEEMAFYEKRFQERNPGFVTGQSGSSFGTISLNNPHSVESMLSLAERDPFAPLRKPENISDRDAMALRLLDDPTLPEQDRAVLRAALAKKGLI